MKCVFGFFVLLCISAIVAAQAPVDDARYGDLLKELRCLVCQNQNLADSGAELAGDLRNIVMERMQAGESDDEIVAYLVSRYGDYVHYRPPVTASTLVLWFAPVLLLVAVLAGLLARRRLTASAENTPADGLNAESLARARSVLRSGDQSEHRN